ncbi:RlpA-like double-psi beta-barrel-protein domain-containing protein-containing protein [Armillaria luteobubalina]|uniref:RlpA-like double-psi beta-barrel-protein domain-containing protein-containing protein n=1 Tax=Armillaria luteobubalina TaxID=153913 RepID=A0AA39QQC2_9AGAR|nr:RlpA-like double-psi beta-barrel-protein domain-containing protein-containing protein [Armillaria luteobubalina]
MFPSFLVVLTLISFVSALASPHMSHAVHRHRSLSARIAAPVAEPLVGAQPVVPKRTRSRRLARRANSGRCNASSGAASSTTVAQQVSSTAPSTSATPESTSAAPATSFTPVSTAVRAHSSSSSSSSSSSVAQETQPATTPTTAPQTTATTSSAQATSTSGSSGGSSSDTHTGEITFYETGLGSCGITSTDSDHIVALSQTLYDQFTPAGNANKNTLCGKTIHIEYGGKSTDVTVVDRCTGCAEYDLDLSPAAFDDLASESLGRLQGATWSFTS